MKRSFIWRPGDWLFAFHPPVVRLSLVPSFTRYAPNWWSFLWLGFEVSRAWDDDLREFLRPTPSTPENGEA